MNFLENWSFPLARLTKKAIEQCLRLLFLLSQYREVGGWCQTHLEVPRSWQDQGNGSWCTCVFVHPASRNYLRLLGRN